MNHRRWRDDFGNVVLGCVASVSLNENEKGVVEWENPVVVARVGISVLKNERTWRSGRGLEGLT